jgi:release factor glutamine methyltransferase
MTVLEVIQNSARYLAGKGVESPRLNGELILAHVLQLPRLQLYLNYDRVLTEVEIEAARKLVQRRGRREPLQHILGSANFCGLELRITPDVLVPRPETELLAERAVTFLRGRRETIKATGARSTAGIEGPDGARVSNLVRAGSPAGSETGVPPPCLDVLDIGTGSGCLSIWIAHSLPEALVTTVDLSAAALAVARENARQHGVDSRIEFLAGDAFEAIAPGRQFDLLVSNPPYIPSGEIATLEPEVRDYDPRLALDGGADGLDFHRRIAAAALDCLKPGGRLMVELGHDQAGAVREIFSRQMWIVEAVEPDYSRIPRILIASRG